MIQLPPQRVRVQKVDHDMRRERESAQAIAGQPQANSLPVPFADGRAEEARGTMIGSSEARSARWGQCGASLRLRWVNESADSTRYGSTECERKPGGFFVCTE